MGIIDKPDIKSCPQCAFCSKNTICPSCGIDKIKERQKEEK